MWNKGEKDSISEGKFTCRGWEICESSCIYYLLSSLIILAIKLSMVNEVTTSSTQPLKIIYIHFWIYRERETT